MTSPTEGTRGENTVSVGHYCNLPGGQCEENGDGAGKYSEAGIQN